MVLCENRPEGFGPRSTLSPHLPTTCFVDVIVVPLATWVYLVALIGVIPVILMHRARSISDSHEKHHHPSSATATTTKARTILRRTLKTIYYVLVVAMLALVSLELARLVVAELGIGLLPFTYVGVLGALLLHVCTELRFAGTKLGVVVDSSSVRQRWIVKLTNGLFWILLLCVMAIKVAAQAEEKNVVGHRTGQQAMYPISDSITDNATMVGVELVLFFLELLTI